MVFAITEPDAGSNSHRITTTARRDGDDYLISGQKYYISGVDEAAAIITVTRTGVDPVTGKAELSLFLVPVDAPGLSWNRLDVAAQIPDRQFTVFYDDVRVPATALIGEAGKGWAPLFDGLNPERIAAAAIGVGIGRYAVDTAADYARTRNVWGQPIGAHQGVSHPLAKAKIQVELAALMTAKAAWLYDQGLPAGEASNMAKYAAAEAATAAVDAAIQVHGGQRAVRRIRPDAAVGDGQAAADRPGEQRDGAQLRGPAQPQAAQIVLSESDQRVSARAMRC